MKARKYSKSFSRDWDFYNRVADTFNIQGKLVSNIICGTEGKSAKECFYLYDSNGVIEPCCEPDLLKKILTCKSCINLHVKMWGEGRASGLLVNSEFEELIKEYQFPSWIIKAVNQSWVRIWKAENNSLIPYLKKSIKYSNTVAYQGLENENT